MDAHLEAELRKLLDRQQIHDCILRYARGVDRLDDELFRTAYHEDAIDFHGPVNGGPAELSAWYRAQQAGRQGVQHFLANQSVDLDGDTAHAETYFIGVMRSTDDTTAIFSCGRYVDRLERRDGEWRIALRVVIRESRFEVPVESSPLAQLDLSRLDRTDPSYERPLQPPAPPAAR